MANQDLLRESTSSLVRMQSFDPTSLRQERRLGEQMCFGEAVDPAEKLVNFYRRLSPEILEDLTNQQLTTIRDQSNADFNRFDQIIKFDVGQNNAAQTRASMIAQLQGAYDAAFNALWGFVAYGVAKNTDSSLLEVKARAALQSIEDGARDLTRELEKHEKDADDILTNIKKVAAEQGVSQQASYFKELAEAHLAQSVSWRTATISVTVVTVLFALLSAFAFKISWMRPENSLDAIEFMTGKVIFFLTLGAIIALCAKNFLAHQHNAIVNRHRQAALQTYRSLVEAGSSVGTQDIVLAQAAACIFGPQETGFSKDSQEGSGGKSVMELLTKSVVSSVEK